MTRRSRWLLSVAGCLAASLGIATLAWACSPQAGITPSPNWGPAGTVVSVEGSRFQPGSVVQVTWESATGEALATATVTEEGTWSAPVEIPDYPTDEWYTIVARAPYTTDEGQEMSAHASAPFLISSNPPQDAARSDSVSSSARSDSDGTGGGAGTSAQVALGRQEAAKPSVPAGTGPAPVLESSSSAAAPAEGDGAVRGDAGRERVHPAEASPSERTAGAELSSGFASTAPSLLPSLTEAAPAQAPRSAELVTGVVLMALGVVALMGGALVAEVRRRRAHADGTH